MYSASRRLWSQNFNVLLGFKRYSRPANAATFPTTRHLVVSRNASDKTVEETPVVIIGGGPTVRIKHFCYHINLVLSSTHSFDSLYIEFMLVFYCH